VRGRDRLSRRTARPPTRVYLAGPLFTVAERDFNATLARRLDRLGFRVFLPQRDAVAGRGSHRTRRLYERCLDGLRAADVVVAVCDGPTADDGTAWEVGYAVAAGKTVYALRTDSRWVARDEHVNLMIQHSVAACFRSVPQLLRRLARGSGIPALIAVLALTVLGLTGSTSVAADSGGTLLRRPAPEIGGGPWINSAPLTSEALRGRVVFVEFWTYG